MNKQYNIPYSKAKEFIEEGDVLLFKGKGFAAWWIKKAGQGEHTHVGLASWPNHKVLEILEFREGNPLALIFGRSGTGEGHAVILSRQVKSHDGRIDVYRPSKRHQNIIFDGESETVKYKTVIFNGKKITNAFRRLTGQPYGWKTIWGFVKYSMFGLRLIYNTTKRVLDDTFVDQNFPVCSTSVAMVFRDKYVDLVPNKSDSGTIPADLSRSSTLNYLFTLTWDDSDET